MWFIYLFCVFVDSVSFWNSLIECDFCVKTFLSRFCAQIPGYAFSEWGWQRLSSWIKCKNCEERKDIQCSKYVRRCGKTIHFPTNALFAFHGLHWGKKKKSYIHLKSNTAICLVRLSQHNSFNSISPTEAPMCLSLRACDEHSSITRHCL